MPASSKRIKEKMQQQQLQQEQEEQEQLQRTQSEQMEADAKQQAADERSGGGSSMELRKVRTPSAKKRVLEEVDLGGCDAEPRPKRKATSRKNVAAVPKSSGSAAEDDDDECTEDDDEDDDIITEEEEVAASDSRRGSESNTMTLEQFTDIVLASEGLAVQQKQLMMQQQQQEQLKRKEENNNEDGPHSATPTLPSATPKAAKDVAASLMQNNTDLIVEVKPLASKPVVLSPRQPPMGSHLLMHRGNPNNPSLANSVVVSVKPRLNAAATVSAAAASAVLPSNKPPSVPRLVEEWFRRMQPPVDKSADSALNLSTKCRPTQVYLRPIEELSQRVKSEPTASASASAMTSGLSSAMLSRHNHAEVIRRPASAHILQQQHPSATTQYSTQYAHSLKASPPRLSPPRLEIKKVDACSSSSSSSPLSSSRKVCMAAPFESTAVHMESVRMRALRDVQLAHTKDMHGNYPIHMAVLMRKAELVRRYCCILQVLESSVDLVNDDKMTPLHLAIRDNSVEIISVLLSFGADPAAKDRRGNSSLHIATAVKATDILATLANSVRNKEDLNVLNEYGVTPLHIATMNGDTASAEILTKCGADPTIPDSVHGLTPLAMAKQEKLETMEKKTIIEIPSR